MVETVVSFSINSIDKTERQWVTAYGIVIIRKKFNNSISSRCVISVANHTDNSVGRFSTCPSDYLISAGNDLNENEDYCCKKTAYNHHFSFFHLQPATGNSWIFSCTTVSSFCSF